MGQSKSFCETLIINNLYHILMLSISELSVSFGGVKALNLSKFELNDKELRVIM
ncbi:putative ABC-type transport system, ATPase component [Bacteroidales bacterium Barb4]|nr:putative ABC-type transport system, ATPase component [Bacteroidales bacterium Barb4]